MRDIGKPTVTVHIMTGTPEEIARNRENARTALESSLTRRNGYGTKVTINWKNKMHPE